MTSYHVEPLHTPDKPEDIEVSLGQALDYLTLDAIEVDEIDWEQMAKEGG